MILFWGLSESHTHTHTPNHKEYKWRLNWLAWLSRGNGTFQTNELILWSFPPCENVLCVGEMPTAREQKSSHLWNRKVTHMPYWQRQTPKYVNHMIRGAVATFSMQLKGKNIHAAHCEVLLPVLVWEPSAFFSALRGRCHLALCHSRRHAETCECTASAFFVDPSVKWATPH